MIYGEANYTRTVVAHLDKGEDILESLRVIVKEKNIKNGVILAGYGTMDRCRFHMVSTVDFPPVDEFLTVEGPLELMSIDGFIAGGEVHAHLVAASPERCFGGHLESGSRVLYLCDVAIGILESIDMAFEMKPSSLRLLTFRPATEKEGPRVELDAQGRPSQR